MASWQKTGFGGERANLLVGTPVAAHLLVENAYPKSLLLKIVEGLADFEWRGIGESLDDGNGHLVSQRFNRLLPGDLAGSIKSCLDSIAGDAVGDLQQFVRNNEECCLALGLSSHGGQFLLRADEMTDLIVRKSERGDEIGFGNLPGVAFDHDHVVLGPDVDKIEVARKTLRMHRVGHELAVDTAHANGAHWAGKRDIGNTKCGARAIDEEHIRIMLAVRAQQDADNLSIVEVTLWEERAKRTIRHAAGENFLLRRPALPLEVSSGKLADRGCFLPIVDREREKVLAFLGDGCGDCGHENDGFAGADSDCAVRESREFARFDGDRRLAESGRN